MVFTGTQAGMNITQLELLEHLLAKRMDWTEHGNGLCIGADSQMLVTVLNIRGDIRIRGFPCNIISKQSRHLYPRCHSLAPVKPPLIRNTDMVVWAEGGVLVAAPRELTEQLYSGTWSTIRRARKVQLPIIYLWPDGRLEEIP
jgi:hypothetical protein